MYTYTAITACAGNSPDGTQSACQEAVSACAPGTGPLLWIFRRQTAPTSGPWTMYGQTCNRADIPANPLPLPTSADVLTAFRQLPFAKPTLALQPTGGHTLINLPTYFALTWPQTGLTPGASTHLTLLGHGVDVRIRLDHYTYGYGDGATSGATRSTGGPYPDGDLTHTYRTAGTYTPTVTTVLTGDYRINAGPWRPLDGTASITHAFPPLAAHAVTNRLVPNAETR